MGGEPIQDTLAALREAINQFALVSGAAPPQTRRDWQRTPAPGTTPDERRWAEIDHHFEGPIAGRRVLVVGSDVAYDASAFVARGAEHVLACDWRSLDTASHGSFDIVHCNGLLHRVLEPIELLRTLRRMIKQDGTLLIGTMMLADPERSEYLRFVPDRHGGDPTWWFVPGRLAFRWLVQTAGFEIEGSFGEQPGPRDGLALTTGYLRAAARE